MESDLAVSIDSLFGVGLEAVATEQVTLVTLNHALKGKLSKTAATFNTLSLRLVVRFIEIDCQAVISFLCVIQYISTWLENASENTKFQVH